MKGKKEEVLTLGHNLMAIKSLPHRLRGYAAYIWTLKSRTAYL